uniref:Rap guanine nucleotide exchange factor (GEF) 3 n=1 Tax=Esox lucius TaxID=8010 RepID=A0A3P8XD37_ESOLU
MDTVIKSILLPSRRMTQEGETPLPEALDTQDTMKQFLSDRILKAAKAVYCALIERNPGLIRDRKHHLKTYRQCCSGKELVDWLMKLNECFQSRSQAVGMWQVLVDEGIIVHVKQEFNFHDKDTQLYRFMDSEFGLNQLTNEKDPDQSDDDLQEGLSLLLQMGPDALLTMILRKCPSQRSAEDLEVIYEELLHVKAVAHLSTSVRKELAAVLVFESHAKAGTVLFSQGDKGTSWYIIWKGSVNVITHGKGLVTTLHEGEDFGQLALVNDAPRAATIILREDNCHFLRVDKQDFIRILKVGVATAGCCVDAVFILMCSVLCVFILMCSVLCVFILMCSVPCVFILMCSVLCVFILMFNVLLCVPSDPCVTDFLLTHRVFMPSSQLCPCTYHSEPSEGSELEKAAYALNTKQKIVKLIGQWVALFGQFLKDDPIAVDFLEVGDWWDSAEQWFQLTFSLLVLYELFRPDHTSVTVVLPVISSVQDLLSSLVNPGGGHILVKINSMGGRWLRFLFTCPLGTPLREQQGPEHSNTEFLEQMCSKDIAGQLTNYDWELFTAMHEVELVYYVFGQHNFPGTTTANLERFVHRFNQVQYWVVTEVCLCDDLVKRAMLLKKFIKIAAMLKEQKNLNSFFAVMFGLSNSAVQRLYKTWERVPSKTKRVYCAYERLMDPSRNHRAYRLAVAKLTPPYIPFMPLLLKDMTFMHEGNQNYTEKLVNFEKMRMIAKIVKIVRGCRSTPYGKRTKLYEGTV